MIRFEIQRGISEEAIQKSIAMAMMESVQAASELVIFLTSMDEDGQSKFEKSFERAVIEKHKDTSDDLLSDRIMDILTEDRIVIH